MRIYISGAITGDKLYRAKFEKAKQDLKKRGHIPVNPAEFELPDGASWEDYMKQDLSLLLKCDGIYMLKDWNQSRGAKLEHDLAEILGLQIQYEPFLGGDVMTISSYFGLKSCCDCGRTGNYTINKNGFQLTVCADCLQNYSEEEEQTCSNCKHYAKEYELCCYSLGDEDYDCRGRKWEVKEND